MESSENFAAFFICKKGGYAMSRYEEEDLIVVPQTPEEYQASIANSAIKGGWGRNFNFNDLWVIDKDLRLDTVGSNTGLSLDSYQGSAGLSETETEKATSLAMTGVYDTMSASSSDLIVDPSPANNHGIAFDPNERIHSKEQEIAKGDSTFADPDFYNTSDPFAIYKKPYFASPSKFVENLIEMEKGYNYESIDTYGENDSFSIEFSGFGTVKSYSAAREGSVFSRKNYFFTDSNGKEFLTSNIVANDLNENKGTSLVGIEEKWRNQIKMQESPSLVSVLAKEWREHGIRQVTPAFEMPSTGVIKSPDLFRYNGEGFSKVKVKADSNIPTKTSLSAIGYSYSLFKIISVEATVSRSEYDHYYVTISGQAGLGTPFSAFEKKGLTVNKHIEAKEALKDITGGAISLSGGAYKGIGYDHSLDGTDIVWKQKGVILGGSGGIGYTIYLGQGEEGLRNATQWLNRITPGGNTVIPQTPQEAEKTFHKILKE